MISKCDVWPIRDSDITNIQQVIWFGYDYFSLDIYTAEWVDEKKKNLQPVQPIFLFVCFVDIFVILSKKFS